MTRRLSSDRKCPKIRLVDDNDDDDGGVGDDDMG